MDESEKKLKAVLDGSSGFGAEFLPVETANEIIARVFDESWVRSIFRSYPMGTETVKIPKMASGVRMYGTTGNKNVAATETRWGSAEVTLEMKTIIGNHPIDKKTLAYSIGAMMPGLKDDLVNTVLETEDDVFINGDKTAGGSNINGAYHLTNYPNGIISQDARLEMDGLRHFAIANESNNSKYVNASGTALSTTHLRSAFSALGKFGKKKEDLIILCSLSVGNQMLGWEEVETLEKYGPKATILTGEIGQVYGARILQTSIIPETLNDTGVARSQAANPELNRTVVLVFSRRAAIIGNPSMPERKFSIEIEDVPKQDMIVLIPKEDFAFASQYEEAIVHIRNVLPG